MGYESTWQSLDDLRKSWLNGSSPRKAVLNLI